MSLKLTAKPSISVMVKRLGPRGVEGLLLLLLLLFIILCCHYSIIHSEAAFQRLSDPVKTQPARHLQEPRLREETTTTPPDTQEGILGGSEPGECRATLTARAEPREETEDPGARIAAHASSAPRPGANTTAIPRRTAQRPLAGTTERQRGRWLLELPKQDEAYLGAGTVDGAKGASERTAQGTFRARSALHLT